MFIQIHTLTSYAASLLNRDDTGLAKRIEVGGKVRTRVSSQCQKRHWRDHLIASNKFPSAVRSTTVFETIVLPLVVSAGISEARARTALRAILGVVVKGGLNDKGTSLETKQAILLGKVECEQLARVVAGALQDEAVAPESILEALSLKSGKGAARASLADWLGVSGEYGLSYGIEAALFGRMVTSDALERTDGAMAVAHGFTVHEAAPEMDFFTVVDDLAGKSSGADHIDTTEISAGTFYTYAVIDVPLLVSNITGAPRSDWLKQDHAVTREAVACIMDAMATVTPGAKKGSTACYSHADLLLVEVSPEQPRTLANAFRRPVDFRRSADPLADTVETLSKHLATSSRLTRSTAARFFAGEIDQALPPELATEMPDFASVAEAALAKAFPHA